jgi:hypothetical protein
MFAPLSLVLLVACGSRGWESEPFHWECGLRMELPVDSSRQAEGCALTLQQRQVRSPWSIRLEVTEGEPELDCRTLPRLLPGGGVAWACGREESSGGSGGTEFERQGWMRLEGERVLRFQFQHQAEWPARPAETVLWAVLGSVEEG